MFFIPQKRRFTALLLCVLLIISCAACGSAEAAQSQSSEPEPSTIQGADSSETSQDSRQTITIATLYASSVLTEAVSQFNQTSDTYQAQILDYGIYVSENGDLSTAQNLIYTELVTGGGPDIISFGLMGSSDQTGISAEKLSALGLLEDLYPYLDTDPELSTDTFYPGLMSLLDCGGSLYQLPSGFYIRTAVGSEAVVGNRNGWNFSDMLDCAGAMPDLQYTFGSTISRSRLTELILAFNSSQFVDYTTGECHFDSPEFVELLNFLNTCYTSENGQREIPAYAVAAGRQMLGVVTVGTVTEMQEYAAIFGDPVYIGMPATEGTGTAFSLTNAVGICANSQSKAGAWEFLKTLCTQSVYDAFPANQKLLDAYFSAPETRDPWDMTVGYEDDEKNTWELAFTKPTSEDVQRTKNLIALADRIYQPDDNISAIVQEEAEAFYSGAKTAEDVAALIQNRVKIYINEQKD